MLCECARWLLIAANARYCRHHGRILDSITNGCGGCRDCGNRISTAVSLEYLLDRADKDAALWKRTYHCVSKDALTKGRCGLSLRLPPLRATENRGYGHGCHVWYQFYDKWPANDAVHFKQWLAWERHIAVSWSGSSWLFICGLQAAHEVARSVHLPCGWKDHHQHFKALFTQCHVAFGRDHYAKWLL